MKKKITNNELVEKEGEFQIMYSFTFLIFPNTFFFVFVVPFTNNTTTNSNDNLSSNSTNDQLKVLEYYEEEYSKVVGLYEKLKNSEEFKNYSYFLLYHLFFLKKKST